MLLVIDSENIPTIKIKQSFSEQGFQHVEVLKTAKEALEYIQENTGINAIVINSELDDADGFKLCQEIRNTEVGKTAYIFIIISSVKNATAIEKAKYSGADNFIVKPYGTVDFQKKLIQFMLKRVIVLVEDDPVIVMTVEKILSSYPVEIISINDGIEAYNLLNTMMPVSLVLLDIGLPNMNGIQLIQQIRSKNLWRKTPVVMLTGSTDAVDVKKALSGGANDYIAKPFGVDDFVKRLSRYLPDGD